MVVIHDSSDLPDIIDRIMDGDLFDTLLPGRVAERYVADNGESRLHRALGKSDVSSLTKMASLSTSQLSQQTFSDDERRQFFADAWLSEVLTAVEHLATFLRSVGEDAERFEIEFVVDEDRLWLIQWRPSSDMPEGLYHSVGRFAVADLIDTRWRARSTATFESVASRLRANSAVVVVDWDDSHWDAFSAALLLEKFPSVPVALIIVDSKARSAHLPRAIRELMPTVFLAQIESPQLDRVIMERELLSNGVSLNVE